MYGGQEEKREASVYHSGALAGLARVTLSIPGVHAGHLLVTRIGANKKSGNGPHSAHPA
jgi:hypothetical protein